ncbi:hypothetical protein HY384_03065 [Candidatus Daviesbacteria bacterium]|nr:hypothetical protein [Candidatus Daviesbacteria bacterium]
MVFKIRPVLVSLSLLTTSLVLPVFTYAQELKPPPGSVASNIRAEAIPKLIVDSLFLIASFLAVAYLMYGGIRWITSRGDKAGVEAARKHIIAAIVGVVVVAGAFFLMQLLFTILDADNPISKNFKLPTLKDIR